MNQRITKLRKSFEQPKIDALLVTEPLNVRYLTGFVGLTLKEREAYVLVTESECYLISDGRYSGQVAKLKARFSTPRFSGEKTSDAVASNLKLKTLEIKLNQDFVKLLNGLMVKLKIKRLGFEKNDLKFGEYKKLAKRLKGTRLFPTRDLVENLRAIKEKGEIKKIKKAVKITDKCFEWLLKFIKPGLTEGQLAWEIEKFIRERGADLAFKPIVASGPNSAIPHHFSSRTYNLKPRTSVLLDFGAKFDGYCSDMTRVVFLGRPTKEQKRVYQIVKTAQQKALSFLNKAAKNLIYLTSGRLSRRLKSEKTALAKEVDKVVRDYLKKAGFPDIPHGLGHGVGLSEHEKPILGPKSEDLLKPGMVFTIEPGIYLKGKFGIRIEDLVLLKGNKVQVLTKARKDTAEL